MSDNQLRVTMVDSTYRVRWEVTKEEFDNCQFPLYIMSPNYTVYIDDEESELYLEMYPKGDVEHDKNKVVIFLYMDSGDKTYKVKYDFGIETQAGYWPQNDVKKFYSRGSCGKVSSFGDDADTNSHGWGHVLCTTKELEEHFVENKLTVVASFVIYVEGDKYRNHMEVADEFVDDMRSMSSLQNLADFTIICGNTRFYCHRLLLAARSKYFEALFRNEPAKIETEMEESPELVKIMLEFMSKGVIPEDIDDKAMDLILMSDMYGLDLLTVACQTSMVDNLSPDNAIETLIMIDKLKHVSKSEHREKVLAYIKKEADKVVKAKDWKKFILNYPDLITEIVLVLHKEENNGTSKRKRWCSLQFMPKC